MNQSSRTPMMFQTISHNTFIKTNSENPLPDRTENLNKFLDLNTATDQSAKIIQNKENYLGSALRSKQEALEAGAIIGGVTALATTWKTGAGLLLTFPAGLLIGAMVGQSIGTRSAAKLYNLDLKEVKNGKIKSELSHETTVIKDWLGSTFREYKKSKDKNNNKENIKDGLEKILAYVKKTDTKQKDRKAILDQIHLIQKGTVFSGFNSGGYRAMKKNDNDMYTLIRQIKDTIKQSA